MDEAHAQTAGSRLSDLEIVQQLKVKLESMPDSDFTIDRLLRDAPDFLEDADAYGFDQLEPIKQWAILITETHGRTLFECESKTARNNWLKVRLVALDAWREIEVLRGREGDVLAEETAHNELPPVEVPEDATLDMSDDEKLGWAFGD
ncbi:MAG TPA: hypothetical protein VFM96_02835 [Gaiellaceae bacterium]|nr:hypothetical protein [Gaiellaceae bacterium]